MKLQRSRNRCAREFYQQMFAICQVFIKKSVPLVTLTHLSNLQNIIIRDKSYFVINGNFSSLFHYCLHLQQELNSLNLCCNQRPIARLKRQQNNLEVEASWDNISVVVNLGTPVSCRLANVCVKIILSLILQIDPGVNNFFLLAIALVVNKNLATLKTSCNTL